MRRLLCLLLCAVCASAHSASDTPLRSQPLVGVAPTNAGLSLSPLGASIEVSAVSPLLPGARLSATFGYDQTGGPYGFLRYDGLAQLPVDTPPVMFAVQSGVWLHDPHLAGFRTTAFGLKGFLRAAFPTAGPSLSTALEAAGLQLTALHRDYLFDGRAEVAVAELQTDRWGYTTTGWRATATGLWSATASAPSLALWGDATYTEPLPDWQLNLGLRAGYRPAWPIPLTASSDLAALGTLGVSRSLGVELEVIPELLALERISVEPRVRAWVDGDAHAGADITLSADTLLTGTRPVTVSGSLGYADRFWVRFNLRVAP
jgi:hypothetical protein